MVQVKAGVGRGVTYCQFIIGCSCCCCSPCDKPKADIIRGQKLSMPEVHANIKLNRRNYGKSCVLPDVNVYSNFNTEKLGNINHNTLGDIVYKEITVGSAWLKTKTETKPCNACVWNFLCSPITNYEYVINKFNLCDE